MLSCPVIWSLGLSISHTWFSSVCPSNSMGVIGRYNLEIAELYFSSLKENGLTIDMVQVDDD